MNKARREELIGSKIRYSLWLYSDRIGNIPRENKKGLVGSIVSRVLELLEEETGRADKEGYREGYKDGYSEGQESLEKLQGRIR